MAGVSYEQKYVRHSTIFIFASLLMMFFERTKKNDFHFDYEMKAFDC